MLPGKRVRRKALTYEKPYYDFLNSDPYTIGLQ
jgi:hypothetical protein